MTHTIYMVDRNGLPSMSHTYTTKRDALTALKNARVFLDSPQMNVVEVCVYDDSTQEMIATTANTQPDNPQ